MLFPQRVWPGLADGTVTVAFRRWKRPSVKAGGTLTTPAGVLGIDEVALIAEGDVTDADARAAGFAGRDDALASLRPEGELYRVRFHRVGDDPRLALRETADLDAQEMAEVLARLERLPWAPLTLRVIAAHPAVVSADLAARAGVDRPTFKRRVRRLKAMGLTESLGTGYRLSRRGEVVLARLEAR